MIVAFPGHTHLYLISVFFLLHDIASGNDNMTCIKLDKNTGVYVMVPKATLRIYGIILKFLCQIMI